MLQTYLWMKREEMESGTVSTQSARNCACILAKVVVWSQTADRRPCIPGVPYRDTLTISVCFRGEEDGDGVLEISKSDDRATVDVVQRCSNARVFEYNLLCISVEMCINSFFDPAIGNRSKVQVAAIGLHRGSTAATPPPEGCEMTAYLQSRFARLHDTTGIAKHLFLERVISSGYRGILWSCLVA
tara:strand:- start:3073 stop:3630 length:558 start_codon:yes stop_codon:yes gene_type:complete